MGEKKLPKYLTYDDLHSIFGIPVKTLQKAAKDLEPAMLRINGRLTKPRRFDADVVATIIGTQAPKPKRPVVPPKLTAARKRAKPLKEEDDDLWR